jgi:hypothetical protein
MMQKFAKKWRKVCSGGLLMEPVQIQRVLSILQGLVPRDSPSHTLLDLMNLGHLIDALVQYLPPLTKSPTTHIPAPLSLLLHARRNKIHHDAHSPISLPPPVRMCGARGVIGVPWHTQKICELFGINYVAVSPSSTTN